MIDEKLITHDPKDKFDSHEAYNNHMPWLFNNAVEAEEKMEFSIVIGSNPIPCKSCCLHGATVHPVFIVRKEHTRVFRTFDMCIVCKVPYCIQ